MKEKFRELRSCYEKSIAAGEGTFIPTPMTAPSPQKTLKSTETANISSSSTDKVTTLNIKETLIPTKSPSPPHVTHPLLPSTSFSSSSTNSCENAPNDIECKKENLSDFEDLSHRNTTRVPKLREKLSSPLAPPPPRVKRNIEDRSLDSASKIRRLHTTNANLIYTDSKNVGYRSSGGNDKSLQSAGKSKSLCLGDVKGVNSDINCSNSKNNRIHKKVNKYVEVVRKKSDREALPGHTCEECERYYRALQQVGMYNSPNSKAEVPNCNECHDVCFFILFTFLLHYY